MYTCVHLRGEKFCSTNTRISTQLTTTPTSPISPYFYYLTSPCVFILVQMILYLPHTKANHIFVYYWGISEKCLLHSTYHTVILNWKHSLQVYCITLGCWGPFPLLHLTQCCPLVWCWNVTVCTNHIWLCQVFINLWSWYTMVGYLWLHVGLVLESTLWRSHKYLSVWPQIQLDFQYLDVVKIPAY